MSGPSLHHGVVMCFWFHHHHRQVQSRSGIFSELYSGHSFCTEATLVISNLPPLHSQSSWRLEKSQCVAYRAVCVWPHFPSHIPPSTPPVPPSLILFHPLLILPANKLICLLKCYFVSELLLCVTSIIVPDLFLTHSLVITHFVHCIAKCYSQYNDLITLQVYRSHFRLFFHYIFTHLCIFKGNIVLTALHSLHL